ncbi:MAG TPA: CoA-binding protein [Verrucomicrobiota bacterium]|nr:CoA-binding protein [Verrucomicrobiota bacterium]
MKSAAVIGASADAAKFGNKAVRAFQRQGYTVFPVNTTATEIEGLRVFRSIEEVPMRPNLVSVYLPPNVTLRVLPEIARKGCDELWLNSGSESEAVLAEAEKLGLNVVQACSIVGVGMSPDDF